MDNSTAKAIAIRMAELIIDITDPKIARWEKEQREINARAKAKQFIRSMERN